MYAAYPQKTLLRICKFSLMTLEFDFQSILLTIVIFAIAAIYSAIGQGGGTGYLAVMAVGGLAPDEIRPTVLALNILVSGVTGWKFAKAGRFSSKAFWPSVLAGAPAAMLGAWINLPASAYQLIVTILLLFASERVFHASGFSEPPESKQTDTPTILRLSLFGAWIGFISGLTGIGGGIFLSPLLILTGWSDARTAAGTSAFFTLLNSIAGLAVISSKLGSLPSGIGFWFAAAGAGAWVGSELGLRGMSEFTARRLLALVLALAAIRSFLTALTNLEII